MNQPDISPLSRLAAGVFRMTVGAIPMVATLLLAALTYALCEVLRYGALIC